MKPLKNVNAMRKLFFTSFICLMTFFATAQIKLLDLSVIPINENNSNVDSVKVLIQLKINNPALAQDINFLFGTQINQGDIKSGNASVINQGTEFMVSYDGRQETIQNHSIKIYCKMTLNEYNSWQHLTVYATSASGSNSNYLYINH